MGNKIIISTDSTCDLPPELLEEYGISLLPLYITFGETSYRDGIEITPDDLYKKYEAEGVLPKTSAVSVGDFTEYFGKLLEKADQVVHFSLSSALSCTYQNATIAADEYPNRVFVVDTLHLSTGVGMVALNGARLLAKGATAEEIIAASVDYPGRIDASFVVESLEFLHKGGRCSALSALGANLLSIKPCIEVSGGKMDVGKKYRGKFSAVLQKYVEERMANGPYEEDEAFVVHAGCAEIAENMRQLVVDSGLFRKVRIVRAGCTISSHCGPQTLGVFFVRKDSV